MNPYDDMPITPDSEAVAPMTDDHAIEAAARAVSEVVLFRDDVIARITTAAIRAYLAAMEAGAVMVPREPTPEMLETGHVCDPLGCDVEDSERETIYGAIYVAMVGARPKIGG